MWGRWRETGLTMLRIIAAIMNAMTIATMVAVFIYECGTGYRLLRRKFTDRAIR
ncbi:hypothetical protein ACXY7D_18785 [Sphingomonas melonis]